MNIAWSRDVEDVFGTHTSEITRRRQRFASPKSEEPAIPIRIDRPMSYN